MRRHLSRPGPGSIIATVALFLALGGGAIAFSGSGTLQKENEIGIGNPETIRTIAGVGSINAGCASGDLEIALKNTSGETLSVRVDLGDALSSTDNLVNQGEHAISGGGANADELYQFHVSPADGSKSPQADITVSVDDTDNCATSQVAVINLTTTG